MTHDAPMPSGSYPCGHPMNPRLTSCYVCARDLKRLPPGPVGRAAGRSNTDYASILVGPPSLSRVWVRHSRSRPTE
jgi:hypothetical protein